MSETLLLKEGGKEGERDFVCVEVRLEGKDLCGKGRGDWVWVVNVTFGVDKDPDVYKDGGQGGGGLM